MANKLQTSFRNIKRAASNFFDTDKEKEGFQFNPITAARNVGQTAFNLTPPGQVVQAGKRGFQKLGESRQQSGKSSIQDWQTRNRQLAQPAIRSGQMKPISPLPAMGQYAKSAGESALQTVESAGRLTPPYQAYQAVTGQEPTVLSDAWNLGTGALSTLYHLNPAAPFMGSGFGMIGEARRGGDINEILQAGQEATVNQPSFGEAFSDNPRTQTLLNVAYMAFAIGQKPARNKLKEWGVDVNKLDKAYKTLGIEPGTSPSEARQKYLNLAKTEHPDIGGSEQAMNEINKAYQAIQNSGGFNRFLTSIGLGGGGDVSQPISGLLPSELGQTPIQPLGQPINQLTQSLTQRPSGEASSVLQIIDPKTNKLSYKVIDPGQLNKFSQRVDFSGGQGIVDEDGRIYHLTAHTPDYMEAQGFEYAGKANLDEIPEPSGVKQPPVGSKLSDIPENTWYHGTTKKINEFDDSVTTPTFLTKDKKYADIYTYAKDASNGKGKIMEVQFQPKNTFDTSNPKDLEIYNKKFLPWIKGITDDPRYKPLKSGEKVPFTTADRLYNFLRGQSKRGNLDYDSILVNEGSVGGDALVPLKSSEISISQQPVGDTAKDAMITQPGTPDEKLQQAWYEVMSEMEVAAPGERIWSEEGEVTSGVPSTYPEWVPSELRRAELFERVLPNFQDPTGLSYPPDSQPRKQALYDEIINQISSRSDLNEEEVINQLTGNYGQETQQAQEVINRGSQGGTRATTQPVDDFARYPIGFDETPPQDFEGMARVSKQEKPKITGKYADVAQEPYKPAEITLKRGPVDGGGGVQVKYPGFNFENWKDGRAGITGMGRETMVRNLEKVAGKDAQRAKEFLINPVRKNETQRVEWANNLKNEVENKIEKWNIKPGSKDSLLVQRYGEGNITLEELKQQTENWESVVNAANYFRNKYDSHINQINIERVKYNYDPIPKRDDYFRHYQEMGVASYVSGIFGNKNSLPTEIAGLTHLFSPGKPFTSVSLQRKGGPYTEDAIRGYDNYIDAISRQMFHIDSVQRGRALENIIRKSAKGNEKITLPNFETNLHDWVNGVSGKKMEADRAIERIMGREGYKFLSFLRGRTGANMVGGNISSALTNFIPLTQSLATTSKPAAVMGLLKGVTTPIEKDLFKIDGVKSEFLVKRYPKGQIAPQGIDKAKDVASSLFFTVDKFTARSVVAGKFYENLKAGLEPKEAMKQADDYATRVLAQRSIGELPNIINMRSLGVLTQFQTEVNNQFSFLTKDIPRMNNKDVLKIAAAFVQIAILSHVYNNLSEKVVGYRGAMDPIEYIKLMLGYREEDEDKNIVERTQEAGGELLRNLPFTGTRLPIGGAFPRPQRLWQAGSNLAEGDYKTGAKQLWEEAKRPLFYLAPPFGGSQLKKGLEGIQDYARGRSETATGRVRFPVEKGPVNFLRQAGFGRWSGPEAQEYLNQGPQPLGEKQSAAFRAQSPEEGRAYYQQVMDERGEEDFSEKQGLFARIFNKDKEDFDQLEVLKAKKRANMELDPSEELYVLTDGGLEYPGEDASRYEIGQYEEEKWKTVNKFLNDDEIDTQKELAMAEELGISGDDLAYYDVARENVDLRTMFVLDEIERITSETNDRREVLQFLAEGRREVGGETLVTGGGRGVTAELLDRGLITSAEKKYLDSIEYKDGKPVVDVSGRGSGAKIKKISISKGSAPSAPKGSLSDPFVRTKLDTVTMSGEAPTMDSEVARLEPLRVEYAGY